MYEHNQNSLSSFLSFSSPFLFLLKEKKLICGFFFPLQLIKIFGVSNKFKNTQKEKTNKNFFQLFLFSTFFLFPSSPNSYHNNTFIFLIVIKREGEKKEIEKMIINEWDKRMMKNLSSRKFLFSFSLSLSLFFHSLSLPLFHFLSPKF